MNIKLTVEYDGTNYCGWQTQPNGRSIQSVLEEAVSTFLRSPTRVIGSGRTDAGVHAEGQVANVQLQREMSPARLRNAINGNLPGDVRVLFVDVVPDDFHARYSARGKKYTYRIVHERVMSPFWKRYAHLESRALDLAAMRQCAKLFLGEHDWTAFSAAQSDSETRVRNVTELNVSDGWDSRGRCHLIELTISANGFLRYMVRSIVGTLLAAGRHEIDEGTIARAIQDGDRSLAGATAPPHGLTLMSVQYE